MLSFIESLSYKCVLGCVYPHAPQIPIPPLNSWHVRRGVHPGAIIILHDRCYTVATLRTLLPSLVNDKGYRVVTLSELHDLHCHGTDSPVEQPSASPVDESEIVSQS